MASIASIAFIGGGNMASAMISGLLRAGSEPQSIIVIEPFEAAREQLKTQWGVAAYAGITSALAQATQVIWAVKPQVFREAAMAYRPHLHSTALHFSVAAGIRTDSIAQWLSTNNIVRAMPNTPALIGQGMTGLFARAQVGAVDRDACAQLAALTGQSVWVDDEAQLDAVTAVSGSGPAYVFYFLEAMAAAGNHMGLSPDQAKTLALATFQGATALAMQSNESLSTLRERVTSKGGTTHAALEVMNHHHLAQHIESALLAAQARAKALGDEFGM
jgi:pyrroline-5-carboxylate reductase